MAGQSFRKCDDSDRVGLQCNLVQIKTGGGGRPNESCKQDERGQHVNSGRTSFVNTDVLF